MSTTLPPTATDSVSPTEAGLACDLTAIASDEREAHSARASRLMFTAAQEHHALPDGYAWRFTADDYDELCRFVANERRCCPFVRVPREGAPYSGPVWRRITVDAAVTTLLQSEMASHVPTR